jgi:transcriptional regulator, propionate catabolism operon regulatory protein
MPGNDRYRFAFVSNSAEIAATVKAFCDSELEQMEIRLATMEEAIPVARELLDTGVEVVLGGGATGKLLRKSLDQPVVTIARTPLDVLRALIKAKNLGKEIVLTNFDVLMEGLELYEELLGIRIDQLVFQTTRELVETLERKVRNGGKVVVGSGFCREICNSFSTEAIVIYPSREVIVRALEEARAIARESRKKQGDKRKLIAILQSISEGVISIDAQGTVTLLNETAARKLGLETEEIVGKPLPDPARGLGMLHVLETGVPDIDQIRRVAGSDMVVNTLPVQWDNKIQAVVSSFKLASRIQSIDRKLKQKLYTKGFVARYTMGHLKGESPAMQQLRQKTAKYAATDAAVLILGETGTGKELLAQAIHNASLRRSRPFVAVNCAALPETLLESELFGYEEGAFTGAKRGGKPGLFELANEGTIFLDEIADISAALQVRLLRVLEEREVMRLGGDRFVPVDVRLITSTWHDLAHEVKRRRFRSDLYFRLAVLRLNMPALRDRTGDLPLLLRDLMQRCGVSSTVLRDLITPELETEFASYLWPGNVRELDSLVRRFVALRRGAPDEDAALLRSLLREIKEAGFDTCVPVFQGAGGDHELPAHADLRQSVAEYESHVIRRTLAECGNDRLEAARRLGISTNTLWRKLKK